jgi:FkbM family methyltransferase
MPAGLRRTFCDSSAPWAHEMFIRHVIGNGLRRIVGKDRYIRLRNGYRAEHAYLRKVWGVIHIGANSGQERDLYAAFGLHVAWIEAIPEIFETLKLSISEFPEQHAYNYLIADDDGKAYKLHIADNNGASSSILDLAKHTEMYPRIAYEDAITLKGATLPSVLAAEHLDILRFDALVLDTQGSELKILKGAANLLSNFKFVKVEVPDFESYKDCCQIGELSAFMVLNGFRESNRHPIIHTPGVGTYFDVLYERIHR